MKRVSYLFALFMVLALVMAACGPADSGEVTPGPIGTDDFGTDTGLETSTPALPGTGNETGTPMATLEPTDMVSPTETVMSTETPEVMATATSGVSITGTQEVTGTPGVPPMGMIDPSRVSQLLDFTVEDSAGENLGEVDDLVLNLGSRCLTYVILSPDSALGLESEFVAVPWEGFSVRGSNEAAEDQVLVLDVDADSLQTAPGFNTGEEPDFMTPDWDMDWHDFWTTNITGTGTITGTGSTTGTMGIDCSLAGQGTGVNTSGDDEAMGPDRTVFAEEFLGTDVQDSEGNSLGEIEDVIVDVNSGEIKYFIVAAGGFLGIGEKLIPVPPIAFTYGSSGDEFLSLSVSSDVLSAAPTFDLDGLPGSSTAGWDRDISTYWDLQDFDGGAGSGMTGTPEASPTPAP
jgi:sporulation protein YlmC with PRC-barrel domain